MDFFARLHEASSPEAVVRVAAMHVGAYGGCSASYQWRNPDGAAIGWSTNPPSWCEAYFVHQRHVSDPAFDRKTHPASPIVMRFCDGYPGRETDAAANGLYEELRGIGRTATVFVPDPSVRGRARLAAFNIMTDVAERHFARWRASEAPRLRLIAAAAIGRIAILLEAERTRSDPLTAREREALTLLSKGHRVARIAEHLGISARTAEHHIARARDKVGARTREELIAIAVRSGWI